MSTEDSPNVIADVNKMVGPEYHVASDLQDLHGVKTVVQSKHNLRLIVTAHDDYPILSNLQTVCAWHQCGFNVDRAGREDGNIFVAFTLND